MTNSDDCEGLADILSCLYISILFIVDLKGFFEWIVVILVLIMWHLAKNHLVKADDNNYKLETT